mgnify:CR=1 FL=1
MKDKFMKNGVFSLEYDKETLKDMVLELQEENQKQKEAIDKAIEYIKEKQKIQYKFTLSHIECDYLLQILEDKEVSE